MLESFLEVPKKILINRFSADYVIHDVFKYLLLRSPSHSDLVYWRNFIQSGGVADFVNQVYLSKEKTALNAKVESSKILFMHIPKTAGSSFRLFFERFTKKIYTFHAQENSCDVEKSCFINGHFGFSFMKKIKYDHSFTILRDPIERIISLYRHGSSEIPGWEPDDPIRTHDFGQWISSEDPRVTSLVDSFYIRVVTDDMGEPFENRASDSLKMALKRYSEFSAVGDQSNLRPFCKKVASLLDFPIFRMPLNNLADQHTYINKAYRPRPQLTPEIQSRLSQLTRYDYEIYRMFKSN
jgi:hypothetical protein